MKKIEQSLTMIAISFAFIILSAIFAKHIWKLILVLTVSAHLVYHLLRLFREETEEKEEPSVPDEIFEIEGQAEKIGLLYRFEELWVGMNTNFFTV